MHYRAESGRWEYHGGVKRGLPYDLNREHFWAKVDRRGPDECWPWTASKNGTGYGLFGVTVNGRTTSRRAHRIAWELTIGPIPVGLEVDHICHSWGPRCELGDQCPHRGCCNPAHMRIVSNLVNQARKQRAQRTHCPQGHEYTPDNLRGGDPRYGRRCKKCHNEWERIRHQKQALARGVSLSRRPW